MEQHATSSKRSPTLSETEFQYIAKMAKSQFGLHLTTNKMPLVQSRISRRLRKLGLQDFATYRKLLESDRGATEKTDLLSALTTNVTHFFREKHHFDILGEKISSSTRAGTNQLSKISIWSAGCSTGQEPYSIAMTLHDAIPRIATSGRMSILATDIDPMVLKTAKTGRYSIREQPSIPQSMLSRFTTQKTTDPQHFEMKKILTDSIKFETLNLIKPSRHNEKFDAIFCRNVAIYFDRDSQTALWKHLVSSLKPNGLLFIGHSERLHGVTSDNMKNIGITAYQKYAH